MAKSSASGTSKWSGEPGQRPLRIFVLDREALSLAVRGDREMIAGLELATRGEAEVVASRITLVEAYDGRTTEQRWDGVHEPRAPEDSRRTGTLARGRAGSAPWSGPSPAAPGRRRSTGGQSLLMEAIA
ncbi:hypothetical protein ABZ119_23700 [Streptomyces sp. NPDC006288]|uniref:hypothetical protein n=1 Tax=Streptomyces sp. NPDC006288 TaxID=3156743 RepID=UPI0033A403F4